MKTKQKTIQEYLGVQPKPIPKKNIQESLERKIYMVEVPYRMYQKLMLISEKTGYSLTSIIRVMSQIYMDEFVKAHKCGIAPTKACVRSEDVAKVRFPMSKPQIIYSQRLKKDGITRNSYATSFFYYAIYKFQKQLVACDMDLECLAAFK